MSELYKPQTHNRGKTRSISTTDWSWTIVFSSLYFSSSFSLLFYLSFLFLHIINIQLGIRASEKRLGFNREHRAVLMSILVRLTLGRLFDCQRSKPLGTSRMWIEIWCSIRVIFFSKFFEAHKCVFQRFLWNLKKNPNLMDLLNSIR